MTTGFLFSKEIPRLIIIYTYILSTLFSILIRVFIYTLWGILYKKNILKKKKILILTSEKQDTLNPNTIPKHPACTYLSHNIHENYHIESLIRNKKIDAILLLK